MPGFSPTNLAAAMDAAHGDDVDRLAMEGDAVLLARCFMRGTARYQGLRPGEGILLFAGERHQVRLNGHGLPKLTPVLRAILTSWEREKR